MWFRQDCIRGIAQHNVICRKLAHTQGTEMILKPDKQIFGELVFSGEIIQNWAEEHIADKAKVRFVDF